MIDLQQAELILSAAKRLRDNVKKHEALRSKSPDFRDVTPRKLDAHNTSLTWLAMAIDKDEFALHTEVVRGGVCRPYEDDHYTDTVHRPSAFHTYDFKRPHPLKGR